MDYLPGSPRPSGRSLLAAAKRLRRSEKRGLFWTEMPVNGPRMAQNRVKVLSRIYTHGRPKAPENGRFLESATVLKRVPTTLYGGCVSPISAEPLRNGAGLRMATMPRGLAAPEPLPACFKPASSPLTGNKAFGIMSTSWVALPALFPSLSFLIIHRVASHAPELFRVAAGGGAAVLAVKAREVSRVGEAGTVRGLLDGAAGPIAQQLFGAGQALLQ